MFSSVFAYTHDSDTDSNIDSSMGNSQRKLNGETMTVYVRGKRGFEFRDDWPEPMAPTKDEVVLKVSTAAINPVGYKLGKGMLGKIVGLDVCGVVEAVGDQSPFKVGDKVYGRTKGSLAQKTTTKSSLLSLAPSNLSIDAIAAIPTVYVTGLQALRDQGGLQAGGSVLVIGASGGCGLAGVQIAKALGAGRVVGVCSGKNRELVLANGADAVVDYTKENFWDMPEKFDLVYDTATNSGGNEEYKLRVLSVLKTKADSTNGKHDSMFHIERRHAHSIVSLAVCVTIIMYSDSMEPRNDDSSSSSVRTLVRIFVFHHFLIEQGTVILLQIVTRYIAI